MIGQYLPQTNESATVPKTFQFSELNKALYIYKLHMSALSLTRREGSPTALVSNTSIVQLTSPTRYVQFKPSAPVVLVKETLMAQRYNIILTCWP